MYWETHGTGGTIATMVKGVTHRQILFHRRPNRTVLEGRAYKKTVRLARSPLVVGTTDITCLLKKIKKKMSNVRSMVYSNEFQLWSLYKSHV